jgi:geranylgeranyl diphosphate synthase type II
MDIGAILKAAGESFERRLRAYLDDADEVPPELLECMRYSLLAPAKRLRPFLVQRCHALCGGQEGQAEHLAVAVECAHVFTLIHDDLPCMDDATLRRGQAACHCVFGEAMAILAGDALLALALELAARPNFAPPVCLALVRELASAIGMQGVIGGQVSDIAGQRRPPDIHEVTSIHTRKTARLLQCCCRLGALAAGADPRLVSAMSDYGLRLGLAFQIVDDLLDLTPDETVTGKAAVGPERSLDAARQHVQAAAQALAGTGVNARELCLLADHVLQRTGRAPVT